MKKLLFIITATVLALSLFTLTACDLFSSDKSDENPTSASGNVTSTNSGTASADLSTDSQSGDSASASNSANDSASTSMQDSTSESTSTQDSASDSGNQSANDSQSASGSQSGGGTDEQISESDLDFTVTFSKGTENAYTITRNSETEEYTVAFTTISANTVYSMSGTLKGNIVIDGGDDYKFELEMTGLAIESAVNAPIAALSGDEFTLTAKKGTTNTITDKRADVSADEDAYGSAVYSVVDTTLGGKGTLTVTSEHNNGIHTKDDLEVKNLTLTVNCVDNALKGNDSVTITSGTLTLIARQGDGIKTSNSDIKYNDDGTVKKYKGTVEIHGGTVNIYAACDGIDAAYNAVITEQEGSTTTVNIYTDKYSEYSEEVTEVAASEYYLRATTNTYNYSVYYSNSADETQYVWKNAEYYTSVRSGRTTYYYYKVDKPSAETYNKMTVYAYTSNQTQGQAENCAAKTKDLSQNDSFDTLTLSKSGTTLNTNWTNFTTTTNPGGFPGVFPGGMQEGNTDKGSYSTKGIKADNEITLSGGTIFIKAYDDAIHANNDNALESGNAPLGNVTVSGGTLTLYSNDDGLHADGILAVTGGTITVTNAYEGIEANVINISGGMTYVTAKDDGVNATKGNSATAINVTGGYLDVTVSPSGDTDGIDSNGTYTQSGGIVITRGPNNQNMAALDTDGTRKITGGTLIILGYGSITTGTGVTTYSLSLHSSGDHTITVDGVSYTFNNAYSYGKTTCYSSVTVTGA